MELRRAATVAYYVMVAAAAWLDHAPVRPSYQTPPRATAGAAAPIEADLLRAHNAERARVGLAPLTIDARLTLAARWQAEDCARMGRLTHVGRDGSWPWARITRAGYRYSGFDGAQENAFQGGAGWEWTAADMVRAWMGSSGHRANVLGKGWQHFGAATATGRKGERYAIACFGRPG